MANAGRKFWLCVFALLLVNVWFGLAVLPVAVYQAMTLAIVGGYVSGNVIQKGIERVGTPTPPEAKT